MCDSQPVRWCECRAGDCAHHGGLCLGLPAVQQVVALRSAHPGHRCAWSPYLPRPRTLPRFAQMARSALEQQPFVRRRFPHSGFLLASFLADSLIAELLRELSSSNPVGGIFRRLLRTILRPRHSVPTSPSTSRAQTPPSRRASSEKDWKAGLRGLSRCAPAECAR